MARGRKKNEDDERQDPFGNGGPNDAAERLAESIERFEELETEILERREEQREIMKELGGQGYNTKTVRRVIAAKKAKRANPEAWKSAEDEFQLYMQALGLIDDNY